MKIQTKRILVVKNRDNKFDPENEIRVMKQEDIPEILLKYGYMRIEGDNVVYSDYYGHMMKDPVGTVFKYYKNSKSSGYHCAPIYLVKNEINNFMIELVNWFYCDIETEIVFEAIPNVEDFGKSYLLCHHDASGKYVVKRVITEKDFDQYMVIDENGVSIAPLSKIDFDQE